MRNRQLAMSLSVVCIAAFFGYIAYKTLFYDAAAPLQKHLTSQLDASKSQSKLTSKEVAQQLGYRRALIALQEYKKHVYEARRGCNCGPEIDKYTEGLHAQWCTMFVSWVTKQAGAPFNDKTDNSWKITNSRQLAQYLQQHGTWYSAEEAQRKNLKPRVGDIVIFWRGDYEDNLGHATIVIDNQANDGTADLIGGNQKDRVALSQNFPWLHNYGLLGFGRPEKD